MAEKINFTQSVIGNLPLPEPGVRTVYRDARTQGLTVVVSSTGVKSFVLSRRMGGKPEKITLGKYPALCVTEARKACSIHAGHIAQKRNPAVEGRKKRAELRFGELFELYLAKAKLKKRSWEADGKLFKRHLAVWETRKLTDITRANVSRFHAAIAEKTPFLANRLVALLSTIFNFAIKQDLFDERNPASMIDLIPEEKRERYLMPDEIGPFFQALETEGQPWCDLFKLGLFTGARKGNILSMKWSALELYPIDDTTPPWWKISGAESKNKRSMLLPLIPVAAEILRRRLAERKENCPWVFESTFKGKGHITDAKWRWKRMMDRAGIENLRIHDLRRSLGSWMATNGTSLHLVGRSLGHSSLKSTQGYSQLSLGSVHDSVRSAVDKMLIAADVTPKPLKTLPQMDEKNI